jgi:hypothetical protein
LSKGEGFSALTFRFAAASRAAFRPGARRSRPFHDVFRRIRTLQGDGGRGRRFQSARRHPVARRLTFTATRIPEV